MSKKALTPDELEAQADALLAAADNAKASPSGKAAASAGKNQKLGKNASHQDAARVLTDEEAKKAGIVRLDDKQVAALPAASWLMGQEKLRELLARGKKKGKLDSGELMEAMDDLNLESDQMDQLYDSLEALNIDIGTEADLLLPELNDDGEPAAEEIADVEEEELVDPNSLVSNFSIDDPVRMYLKEIGKVPLLNPDEEIVLAQAMSAGAEAKAHLDELEAQRKAGETPEITPEEEAALRKTYKKGESAKQKLAEANLRLVVSIAKRYVGRQMKNPLPVTLLRTYYVPAENDGGQNVITYTMEKGAAVPSTLKMTTLVKNYVEAEHSLELDSLKATTPFSGAWTRPII